MNLILINGHVGCLKTTLAYYLSANLSYALISNSWLGKYETDASHPEFLTLRERRYDKARELLKHYLALNIPVVVEANYPTVVQRNKIYSIADEAGTAEVLSITCTSSSLAAIRKRLEYRKHVVNAPDAISNNMDCYLGSKSSFEETTEDKRKNGILNKLYFDSATGFLRSDCRVTPLSSSVISLLKGLTQNGLLNTPMFVSYG